MLVVWYKGYQSEQHPKSGLYFRFPHLNLVQLIEPRTSHMLGKRSTVELFSSLIFLYSVKWSVFVCVLIYCIFMSIWTVCLYVYHVHTWRSHRKVPGPLELRIRSYTWLWPTIWVLGTKFRSSRKATRALNCWAMAPPFLILTETGSQ